MADTRPQTESHRKHGPGSKVADDAADKAHEASLDPDEQGDVGGDQDIDTAGTDADQEVSLKERERRAERRK